MSETLGPYEIRSELGRGAMAVVWRAYDPVLDREVALKEAFVPRGVDSAVAAELAVRFVREARTAARLSHPGIVTIYGADVYDDRPTIVMELVRGETLTQVLRRGALPAQFALAYFEELLQAVGFAHANGVIHRDIKPDNIFITQDGHVKLADFGIAHLSEGTALTQAGTIIGTPGYMAPEQITGRAVDLRADIFALGAVLHEMLTGVSAFGAGEGVSLTTIMYRVVNEPPGAIPESALEGSPIDLRPVVMAALAKEPVSRIPDTRSFLALIKGEESQWARTLLHSAAPTGTPAARPLARTILDSGSASSASAPVPRVTWAQDPPRSSRKLVYGIGAVAVFGLMVTAVALASTAGLGARTGYGGQSAVSNTSQVPLVAQAVYGSNVSSTTTSELTTTTMAATTTSAAPWTVTSQMVTTTMSRSTSSTYTSTTRTTTTTTRPPVTTRAPVITTTSTVRTTTTTRPPTTTTTTAAPHWYVRVYNSDDTGTAYVNGASVVSAGYKVDSGWRDVSGYFHSGNNSVRFTLWNGVQGYTWGFAVKKNDTIVWSDSAGTAGVAGANGGDMSRTNQMVYDRTITVN